MRRPLAVALTVAGFSALALASPGPKTVKKVILVGVGGRRSFPLKNGQSLDAVPLLNRSYEEFAKALADRGVEVVDAEAVGSAVAAYEGKRDKKMTADRAEVGRRQDEQINASMKTATAGMAAQQKQATNDAMQKLLDDPKIPAATKDAIRRSMGGGAQAGVPVGGVGGIPANMMPGGQGANPYAGMMEQRQAGGAQQLQGMMAGMKAGAAELVGSDQYKALLGVAPDVVGGKASREAKRNKEFYDVLDKLGADGFVMVDFGFSEMMAAKSSVSNGKEETTYTEQVFAPHFSYGLAFYDRDGKPLGDAPKPPAPPKSVKVTRKSSAEAVAGAIEGAIPGLVAEVMAKAYR